MSVWAPLLPVAMVGTERQSLPPLPGEIGTVAQQAAAQAADAGTGLLRAAAVLAACSLAGTRGADQAGPLPAAAAIDSHPVLAPGPLRDGLHWALQEGPPRLQHEGLARLAASGHRLPHALLPAALDLGRRSLALRAALLPALGTRGHWLASQRDEWRYAAGEPSEDTPWDEGSLAQRVDLLSRERRRDPAAARERLTEALPSLPAKERAELAAVLSVALSLDDEPVLELLRSDRSSEVRQLAQTLLLRLPEAAATQRAQARVAALLTPERTQWLIDAPQQPAAEAKADRLDTPRPAQDTLGERGWGLYQLVRQVPLPWWTRQLAMPAGELLAWAARSDWHEALLRGWRDVLFAAPQDDWCEALLAQWPGTVLRDDPAAVLALLPRAARERHWQAHLSEGVTAFLPVLRQCLLACPPGETLSPALSQRFTALLANEARGGRLNADYAWRAALPELACVLHAQALAPLDALPRLADDTPALTQSLLTLSQIVQLRQAFDSLPHATSP